MGNAVGRLFVKDHFDAGAKEVVGFFLSANLNRRKSELFDHHLSVRLSVNLLHF